MNDTAASMQPHFSVVIPTYNRAAILPDAIASVLAQTDGDLELVIVDDGSDDATADVVAGFAATDARVRYVPRGRSGVSATRNAGAEAAAGRVLVFLDSDDELVPEALARFRAAAGAEGAPAPVVVSARVQVSPDRREWRTLVPHGRGFLPGAFAIDRDLFTDIGGYDAKLRYGENTELGWRVRRRVGDAHRIPLVTEPLVIRYTRASRPYDLAKYEATRHILDDGAATLASDVAGTRAPRKRRSTYQAIAAVNAVQLGKRSEAFRLMAAALANDPFSTARYRNAGSVLRGALRRRGAGSPAATITDAGDGRAIRGAHALGAIHGVVVTFNRAESLAKMIDELVHIGLETLTIVDNAPSEASRAVAADAAARMRVDYVEMPENSGPAGGIAAGMTKVLEHATGDDWVLVLDDDRLTGTVDTARRMREFGKLLLDRGAPVGALGQIGSRFDRRGVRLHRLSDDELGGPVTVDYVAGNQMPMVRVAAIRDVGVFDASFFFGFDDLEFCQRLQRAGYGIYVYGPAGIEARRRFGRLGAEVGRAPRRETAWRRYYAVRNHIVIMRRYKSWSSAVLVTLASLFGRPLADRRKGQARWSFVVAGVRGAIDAWAGRLGRRFEPPAAG